MIEIVFYLALNKTNLFVLDSFWCRYYFLFDVFLYSLEMTSAFVFVIGHHIKIFFRLLMENPLLQLDLLLMPHNSLQKTGVNHIPLIYALPL